MMYPFIVAYFFLLMRYVKHYFQSSLTISFKNRSSVAPKSSLTPVTRKVDCPYEYLLNLYGKNHFKKIFNFLTPELQTADAELYNLALEVLDTVHFGAILVDDIADESTLRKGEVAAHRIYGSSETVNRAYLVIFNAILKCQRKRPEAVPFILDCITDIHQGQDDSLVWRRDGFDLSELDAESALDKYRHCAFLKTGALFRLVGQLVTLSHEQDDSMSDYGWYCQLQNDCKNVFSKDVVSAKGALAEDLTNGEYSYPILVALYSSEPIKSAISNVFNCRREGKDISTSALHRAIEALQSEEVKSVCLRELEDVRHRNSKLAVLWAREEKMTIKAG